MRHLFILIASAASLTGCILETQLCGRGFVETEAGRCVPEEAPPPYYSDAGFDLGVDAALPEPEPIPEPFEPDPPEPEPSFDPWEGREMLLIVDRSTRDSARRTPASPGFDLDAILLFDPEQESLVGLLSAWETAQINDPYGRNISQDPAAAIGEPDARGSDDVGAYVSLGTEGGFVFYQLELFEPVRSGLSVFVAAADFDGADAQAEIYLCYPGDLDLNQCRSAGTTRGQGEVFLR